MLNIAQLLSAPVVQPDLYAARMQMALSLGWHIVIACFGVGFPALIVFAEWRALRKDDDDLRELVRRWSKALAVLFAVGAVSGTILSFELGILWPGMMGKFGAVIGLPFAIEGIAFFIEAIFLGIYLYGWDLSGLGRRLEEAAAPDLVLPTVAEDIAVSLRLPHVAIELRRGGEGPTGATTVGTSRRRSAA